MPVPDPDPPPPDPDEGEHSDDSSESSKSRKPSSSSSSSSSSSTSKESEPVLPRVRHEEEFVVDVRGDGLCLLKYDTKLHILAARCRFPAHGNNCRANRTANGNDLVQQQGRPLGFLLAWMLNAHRYPDQKQHSTASTDKLRGSKPHFSHDERKRLREWFVATYPVNAAALAKIERKVRKGESQEPKGCP